MFLISCIYGAVDDVTTALCWEGRSTAVVRVNWITPLVRGVLVSGLERTQGCRLLRTVGAIPPTHVPSAGAKM